jgi:alkylation response protein AidB-like acyl-CoA dehydrogenase
MAKYKHTHELLNGMLNLDQEQRMVLQMVQKVTQQEFADQAFSWEGKFPWENMQFLGKQGFIGLNFPEEYGGGGMGELTSMLAIEIIGTECPDTAYALNGQTMVAPRAIEMFGSQVAKEHYLPPVCEGKSAISIAISEPGAGSDVGAMDTQLTEAGDGGFYLNGQKTWVSFVPDADAAVVWTWFPDGNLGTVIMDFDSPGVEISDHSENMAGGSQTHFFMDDVYIPKENVLISGSDAFKKQLQALNWERCGSAAIANAIAKCGFNKAVTYLQSREQFGQPLSEFQGMRWKIAEMATQIEMSRSFVYSTAVRADSQGDPPSRLEACILKLYSSQMVESVTTEALQAFGSAGYQKGHPLEYLYRLQRARRIAAGTDEIMKNNIADVVFDEGLSAIV